MTDPGWAAEMSKLTVGLTVLLVAYAVAHKQRLKRRTKKAASVDPDKLWPKVPGMERGSVLTEQGVRLATFRFDAQHPKAAAILVHGVGVSCRFEFLRTTCDGGLRDRYEDSALDIMRRAGISILGYDHQSHGSSESLEPGVRCYIDQFDDLCRDLLLVHETFCASLPAGTPVFWVGISMGGGVAVRAAQMLATSRPPRGLVLLAPMISLTAIRDEYFCRWLGLRNGHLVPLMHSLSRLVPRLPIVARAKSAVHPHMEAELQADPLNWTRSFRVRVSCEFVKVTESMMARGGPASLEKLRCGKTAPRPRALHTSLPFHTLGSCRSNRQPPRHPLQGRHLHRATRLAGRVRAVCVRRLQRTGVDWRQRGGRGPDERRASGTQCTEAPHVSRYVARADDRARLRGGGGGCGGSWRQRSVHRKKRPEHLLYRTCCTVMCRWRGCPRTQEPGPTRPASVSV